MEYVLSILKDKLRFELQCEHEAHEHIENSGGTHFESSKATMDAFIESRRLARERIPQLQKVIKLIEAEES